MKSAKDPDLLPIVVVFCLKLDVLPVFFPIVDPETHVPELPRWAV